MSSFNQIRRGLRKKSRFREFQLQGEENDGSDLMQDIDVGRNLRNLREERNFSIRALAEKSGLATNTLSLIENGKSSPSVSTLQQLARALGVPITAFFESTQVKEQVIYVKRDQRPRASFDHGLLEDLGVGLQGCAMEPLVVTLDPGAGSGFAPIVHTGHEFAFCLAGRIAFMVADRTYLLEAGDSLFFESHLPHSWHNLDASASQAILVLCPTDERDRPVERHFVEES